MNGTLDSTMSTTMILLLTVILIPLIGVMMAITPYLMKKSECFTVTVPEAALKDPYLVRLKRRYLALMLAVTVVMTVVAVVLAVVSSEFAIIIMLTVGSLLLILIGYGAMLYNRSKVRTYKKQQDWEAVQQESVAFIGNKGIPGALSLKWDLLYLPVIALTLIIGYAGYPSMPDQIPTHMDFSGQINGYMDKSPMVIWMVVLIQLFIALCFVFSHWMILRSKRGSNPNAPATSDLAYGLFARAQSIYLVALGLIICILMVTMQLSFMGVVTIMQSALFIMVGAIIAVVGGIAIAVVYGQGGARVFARMQESSTLLADDDSHWKLGVFYYNPQDPSLFLLERFGVGWTVNFARPAVWVIMIAFVVVTVGFMVAMLMM